MIQDKTAKIKQLRDLATELYYKNRYVRARNLFVTAKLIKMSKKAGSGPELVLELRYLKYRIQNKLRLERRLKTLSKISESGESPMNLWLQYYEQISKTPELSQQQRQRIKDLRISIFGCPKRSAMDFLAVSYVHHHLGDYRSAQQNLQRALELQPDYLEAMHALSKVHEALGDAEKQLHWIDEVLKVYPFFYRSLKAKCFSLASQGRSEEALRVVAAMRNYDCRIGGSVKKVEADCHFALEDFVRAREVYLGLIQSSKHEHYKLEIRIAQTYIRQNMYAKVGQSDFRPSSGSSAANSGFLRTSRPSTSYWASSKKRTTTGKASRRSRSCGSSTTTSASASRGLAFSRSAG